MVANLTIKLAIISCLFISKAVPSLPISLIGNIVLWSFGLVRR